MDDPRRRIANFLAARNTASLATRGDQRPWAASVFFVSDDDLNLYFVTDPKTLHGQHLDDGPVAATINEDVGDWSAIQGVQLTGWANRLSDAERSAALPLYLRKFPDVRHMVDAPTSEQERLIGERLMATPFYRVKPDWIRLIDNRIRFGFKEELTLD